MLWRDGVDVRHMYSTICIGSKYVGFTLYMYKLETRGGSLGMYQLLTVSNLDKMSFLPHRPHTGRSPSKWCWHTCYGPGRGSAHCHSHKEECMYLMPTSNPIGCKRKEKLYTLKLKAKHTWGKDVKSFLNDNTTWDKEEFHEAVQTRSESLSLVFQLWLSDNT